MSSAMSNLSKNLSLPPPSDIIDMETFQQLLELGEEDEENRKFSCEIIVSYIAQAESTLEAMDEVLADPNKDTRQFRALGEYLKGSSSALGIRKVQLSCQRIQECVSRYNPTGHDHVTTDVAFECITALVCRVKDEFREARAWLEDWVKACGTGTGSSAQSQFERKICI
ncbi:signal transduction histidine kinase [Auriculariales sp. MPI-PUGE-AT-0066]|nr:signal transduction histidine kinase [Auriculariales sp. MPI-PUGE-AT-0066]